MNEEADLHERYLKGAMGEADRQAFEQRLADDKAFLADHAEFRAAFDAAMVAGDAALRKKLGAIHAAQEGGMKERAGVVRMFPARWFALAASVALAIVTTYLIFKPKAGNAELFALHVTPYAAPDVARSDSANSDASWVRFGELYGAQRYDEALAGLDALPVGSTPSYLVDFYQGQCLLLKDGPDALAAMDAFRRVLAADNDLHAAAKWYIALAALKENDTALARSQLEELVKAGGYKRDESRELLDALPQK